MDIWEDKEALDKLENQRNIRRFNSGRLTFDCLSAVVKGDRVSCSRGKRLGSSRDGSLSLIQVLRGITSGTCRNCEDFTTEEE